MFLSEDHLRATLIPGFLILLLCPATISILLSSLTLSATIKLVLIFSLYPLTFTNIYYSMFSIDEISTDIAFAIVLLLFVVIIATALIAFMFNSIFLWLDSWKIILLFLLHLVTAILNGAGFFIFIFFSSNSLVFLDALGLFLVNIIITLGSWRLARLFYGI